MKAAPTSTREILSQGILFIVGRGHHRGRQAGNAKLDIGTEHRGNHGIGELEAVAHQAHGNGL
jgi:hypothetical protein